MIEDDFLAGLRQAEAIPGVDVTHMTREEFFAMREQALQEGNFTVLPAGSTREEIMAFMRGAGQSSTSS